MGDIARRAGVHRSTVYYYFPSKDALLAASFVRVLTVTLHAVEQCWQTDEPFLVQLVAACMRGIDIARDSPVMRSLVDHHQAIGAAYHAAEGSELWRAKLADALVRRLEAAVLPLPAISAEMFRPTPSPAGSSASTSASSLNPPSPTTVVTRACCETCSSPRSPLGDSPR
jgi:AcrR family transcriptional regulator